MSPKMVTSRGQGEGVGGRGFPLAPSHHIKKIHSCHVTNSGYIVTMRTYKIYSGAASGNNNAYVTIQRSGRIKSVRWAVGITDKVDGHVYSAELSSVPVTQIDTHDTQGSIDEIRWINNIGAAGTNSDHINVQRIMDYPVVAGERLYLNTYKTVTSSGTTIFIDVQD
jgi:hypothetical protein